MPGFDPATVLMHVTSDTIRRAFDSGTYNRGLSYARDGMVGTVRLRGDRLLGEVRGSGWNVYDQVVRILPGRDGIEFHGNCSCPMAYNCKHVVAVLLTGVERQVLEPAQEAGLSLPAALWLAQLAQLQASAPAAKAPPRPSSTFRLAYVLCPDARTGAPDLLVYKAKVRGDGTIVSATSEANTMVLRYHPPSYVGPDDIVPLTLYDDMCRQSAFGISSRPIGRRGGQLLSVLGSQGRLHWALQRDQIKTGQLTPILCGDTRTATLGWRPTAEGADTVGLRWQFDDGMPIEHVFATEPVYYLHSGFLGELKLAPSLAAMPIGALVELLHESPVLDANEREHMAQRIADLGLDQVVPPPQVAQVTIRDDIVPVPTLVLGSMLVEHFRGRQTWHDYAVPGFDYDGLYIDAFDPSPLRRRMETGKEQIRRDDDFERATAQRMLALGFRRPDTNSPLACLDVALELDNEAAWLHFAQFELDGLRKAGWRIVLNDEYRYNLLQVEDWYADVDDQDDGNAWFSLELGILVEGRRQPLLPLLVQLIRRAPQGFTPAALAAHADGSQLLLQLPGGDHVALPWSRVKPILAVLADLFFKGESENAMQLPVLDAARLAELEQAAQLRWLGGERLRTLGRRLAQFGGVAEVPKPAGLQADLRTYQREGVAWMQFLREFGFAGILADDMGLGKTLQTLTHILIEKERGRLDAPALVVMPTSLIGNWCAEAARFAPGLRVLTLHGKDRQCLFDDIARADIVLTTYALLPRDEATLRAHTFHLLILDESQYIKNSRAKAAQTARLLTARHRLCLTGTPLQNHLGELWSQFHFLMPGLLGDEKSFNANFRKPIEVQRDSERNAFLTRRVKPFMLRRTKDKVASELPPKTEMVLPVELGSGQRDLYETVRVAMDKRVRDEISRKGVARSQIVILDALLKLRQVCCDPRLVKGAGLKAAKSAAGSAKLDTLLELLDTLQSEGRKVLVFSQFTSMLDLIGSALRERALDYVTLTGETEDRRTPIDAFQQGDVPLFLISLKAGGVGLNLTAADVVVHYDPWWNPAAENQATDRAWRIGQDKPVFVYKLIAQGTLEEKIQDLQRRKGDLADAVIGEGGKLNAALTQEDLQAIFAPL